MNKTLKIILIIFGLLIIGLGGLLTFGMYSLEIEDTYGDNQDIFYESKQGDLVVNHTTTEFGEIRKSWTRFYVVRKTDTVDIYEWWDDKDIEIYRPADNDVLLDSIAYGDIEKLRQEEKLELIKKLK